MMVVGEGYKWKWGYEGYRVGISSQKLTQLSIFGWLKRCQVQRYCNNSDIAEGLRCSPPQLAFEEIFTFFKMWDILVVYIYIYNFREYFNFSLVFIAPRFSHHLFFSVFIRKRIICNLSFIPLTGHCSLEWIWGLGIRVTPMTPLGESCLCPLDSTVKEERLAQPIRSHFQVGWAWG